MIPSFGAEWMADCRYGRSRQCGEFQHLEERRIVMAVLTQQSSAGAMNSELRAASADLTERVLRHPFLVGCADGTITISQLRAFLVQHGKYSKYFTRYLCALISQFEDGEDVVRLAENLTEELGFIPNTDVRTPHSRIYANMLKDFGIDIDAYPINPETQNLIDTMFMLCRQPRGIAGLGAMCLGAEALVPSVYARLVDGFRHCGFDSQGLEFFTLHIDCDDDHAATMQEILTRQTESFPADGVRALNAGEIAVSARLRFFDALMNGVQ
jgi:pyrroloquinoline quinone (PQQ) biosynthesis protein C